MSEMSVKRPYPSERGIFQSIRFHWHEEEVTGNFRLGWSVANPASLRKEHVRVKENPSDPNPQKIDSSQPHGIRTFSWPSGKVEAILKNLNC
jgi:hypothetical protein